MLTLPPDYTFLIQLATFFVLLMVLSRLLFSPFLELLAERSAHTTGGIARAAASRAEIESLSARIDVEMAKARAVAKAEVDALRTQTRGEASRVFQRAQQDAAGRLAELREQVAAATREARVDLAADAKSLADAMVAAVVGGGGAGR